MFLYVNKGNPNYYHISLDYENYLLVDREVDVTLSRIVSYANGREKKQWQPGHQCVL